MCSAPRSLTGRTTGATGLYRGGSWPQWWPTRPTPGGCGQGVAGGVAGPASAHGLPAGYTIPAGTPPAHTQAVMFALGQLGKPYVWAAAGPNAFDCSGLTMAAWATARVRLEHYTVDQEQEGQRVNPLEVTAGDLVLIPGSDPPGPGLPGHVGLYVGDGLVVSAVDPQLGVVVQSLVGVRRRRAGRRGGPRPRRLKRIEVATATPQDERPRPSRVGDAGGSV